MASDDLQNMSSSEILELQKKNCIFCKIISKEIPSNEIYSDDRVMVILDINPAAEGHCIILPKQHYQILPQIPDELVGYLFKTAKKISKSLLKSLAVQGTTIFVANGGLAGQKAPHFMLHVIPRKPGDLLFRLPKNNMDEKELDAVQGLLSLMKKPEKKQQAKEQKEKAEEKPKKKPVKKEREAKPKPDKSAKVNIDDIAGLFLGGKNG